ncbi:MAG: serine/threonine protein kinase [Planctomycetaceae bacterium]|nr:serine/threonine protein kinase [Planctomycetaceae bacterium]
MPDLIRDEILADLLARLTEQAQRGESPQLDDFATAHPDLAAELRALWATAQFAEDFGSGELSNHSVGMNPPPEGFDRSQATGNGVAPVGDYELLEKIGEGGMGVVFTARQASLDRVVALKMIQRGTLASENDVARFRAEAAAAAQLEHPNIVPVYEVGEHDGQPYFSMKYIAGTTLARKLAEGPLPPREAAALLLPICRAVAYAHENGIVHRDLKPSNILIDAAGQPLVSDFGLAKRIVSAQRDTAARAAGRSSRVAPADPLTRTGAILGTPAFMSPEQAAGSRGEVGPASDVYSLGAILYDCLTGRPPFQAASPVDVVMMVLEQDPVLPRILNPRADSDLEMIALKCLQKPAELRYRTAAALADDLAAYLANEPISARSTNVTQLVSRIFRETHHAGILENWGLLWMWHSLVLLVLCAVTNWFQWQHVESRVPYFALWVLGMGTWAAVFWSLRRRAGPITFVERQIAHIWGASMVASSLLFAVETLLDMPVLTLSPVLPLIGASVFVIKAGILSGAFYVQAIALFATALVMAWLRKSGLPDFGLTLYGIVSAVAFFVPGWKYWRQRERMRRT